MISVVIPIYNEEENISRMIAKLEIELSKYSDYEVIFIDDGSYDNTLQIIKEKHDLNGRFNYISLSRNFGHQNALKAGLDYAKGDCVISMDGDMQHPVELIHEMIRLWKEGNQVVFSIRKDSDDISFFKKRTSEMFYFLINRLSEVKIIKGAADFRLIDKKVLKVVATLNENHLFLRGLIPWVGFKQIGIEYKASERFAGESKYTILKMIKFAATGITSFSIKPLQISTLLGFFISFISFIYGIYSITVSVVLDINVAGWTSLIVCVLFMGGVQLIFIGIIGEYLGKIFIQVKNRPNYVISDSTLGQKF